MKIALVTHYYEPEVGAPQRRWTAFVRRWVAAGHEVEVLTPLPHYPLGRGLGGHRLGQETGRHGEVVTRLPYLRHGRSRTTRFADQSLTAACASVRRGRWDVVIATAPGLPSLIAGQSLARRAGARFVVEMRDVWPDLLEESGAGGRVGSRLAPIITGIQQSADVVVAVTDTFAHMLSARGISRVRVVPNGVDLQGTPRLPSPAREGSTLEVLYLGNLGESQRLATAVEAARAAGPDVRLTLVGHGVESGLLRGLVADGEDKVRVLDPIVGDARWPVYEQADTCLVQLRDWKAFEATVPSKLYEVMAVGRHVSGAVAGEAATVIGRSGAGHVVQPGDVTGLARLWRGLAEDRSPLDVGAGPRQWVDDNANYDDLAREYLEHLSDLVLPRR